MKVRIKRRKGRNDLVVVYFENDTNFNPYDLSWTPRKEELSEIYRKMKRAKAWN